MALAIFGGVVAGFSIIILVLIVSRLKRKSGFSLQSGTAAASST